MVLSLDIGGKQFAKELILSWLSETGGLNLKLLETLTGLPQKLISPLLFELMSEDRVEINRAIFSVRR